jgi:hypothetical protein
MFLATYGYTGAPKLLLRTKEYSTVVVCIMAELLAKEPLFNVKNGLQQLDKVFGFCELSLLLI